MSIDVVDDEKNKEKYKLIKRELNKEKRKKRKRIILLWKPKKYMASFVPPILDFSFKLLKNENEI